MNRVILLGAGSTHLYGGPSTDDLTRLVVEAIDGRMDVSKNDTFEDIIARIITVGVSYDTKLSELYRLCVDVVQNELISRDKFRSREYDELLKQYLTDYDGNTKIYTLNFDSVPYEVLKESYEVYNGADGRGNFENDLGKFNDSHLSFFNLHGSIHWEFNPVLFKRKVVDGYGGYFFNPLYYPTLVTGRHKQELVLIAPYLFGYVAFCNDLSHAQEIIVIGYSFKDTHINEALASFRKNGSSLIVVDKFRPEDKTHEGGSTKLDDWACVLSGDMDPLVFKQVTEDCFEDREKRLSLFCGGFEDFLVRRNTIGQ